MTAPPDDTTTGTSAIIAALRTERDGALAREAALAEALAAPTAENWLSARLNSTNGANSRRRPSMC